MTDPQTTKIRISITRETPNSMQERAVNYYREISESEAINKFRLMFIELAEEAKNGEI